ncbi:hypothetical protein AAFF_G00417780 [Aldrovandia affinis]|uniref:Uncharacterized protein n=1 Tax=Aldrovandia affinis TaxID=143900 RepID=A0AAD7SAC4_9TELE|nr:hypothetical protein AAFF_G00417780 [Aldrovandia affinis]
MRRGSVEDSGAMDRAEADGARLREVARQQGARFFRSAPMSSLNGDVLMKSVCERKLRANTLTRALGRTTPARAPTTRTYRSGSAIRAPLIKVLVDGEKSIYFR